MRSSNRRWRWARELVTLGAFLLAVSAARSSLADHYRVPSGSMIPTVHVGDHLVVSKLAYGLRLPFSDVMIARFGGPTRGDVAVLHSPVEDTVLLKRVVAGPGDLVLVRGGRVFLNGVPVPIDRSGDGLFEALGRGRHAVRLDGGGGPDFGPVRLGDDEYLVMGDNRGESYDGRSFGLVSRDAFLGRAIGVWLRESRPTWHGL